MVEPVWVRDDVVLAIHRRQLAEHGGGGGIRDEGLLASALARPKNLLAYSGEQPDLAALAASYAYGIARNHPFVDGNKRTALAACLVVLEANGLLPDIGLPARKVDDWEALVIDVAASRLDRDETTARLKALWRKPRARRPKPRR